MIDPYSKVTTIQMWTDEYISRNMLQYHLDGTNDIASRKHETIIRTCDFISEVLPRNKTICDYGCGPGLYTDKLEKMGYDVIGVDISDISIEYAKNQNKNIDYYKMNYITDKVKRKIDFAMMIYCDFGAMAPKSQKQVLKNIHSSLSDEGMFFFDVASNNYFESVKEAYIKTNEVDGFYMKGEYEVIDQIVKYPNLKLVLRHHHIKGVREFHLYNWDKCYDIKEMKILLNDNGFEMIDYFSNTYGDKEFNNSQTISFLCKKR